MDTNVLKTPESNCSIDILRFCAATLAVAAHAFFLQDVSEFLYDSAINMVAGRWIVQFFVCITGYYFSKVLIAGKPAFKKQFPRLLKIYFIWSLIYYSASFVLSVVINKDPISQFLVERVVFFLTVGSYPHLWNFPATLYPIIILTIVYKFWKEKGLFVLSIFSIFLFMLGAMGSPYYKLFENIPLLYSLFNWEGFFVFRSIILIGLPFLTLGYLINRWEHIFDKFSNIKINMLALVFGAIYAIEGVLTVLFLEGVERPYSQFGTYLFIMFLFIALLRHPMGKFKKTSEFARRMANFVYFIHPLIIIALNLVLGFVNIHITSSINFFIIQGICMLMGYALIKIDTNWSNTLLGLPAKVRVAKSNDSNKEKGV